ncbi:MAG: acetylxylan esterase [Candidatus Poribacteria bacterium]|nr:MAG: acetylxylan esterase [Candidatus Poribacteria bacterium]
MAERSSPSAWEPVDRRTQCLRHTDTVFDPPIREYSSREAWEQRRAELRLHLLVSAGLFPLPDRCPLRPQVTGRWEGEDFLIENVYFESLPGFYVTGNLYRPKRIEEPVPGVACPHGHARRGRFEDTENFSVPARCVTLARLGYVVFSYDMIGYNDSLQLPHDFRGERESLWGLSLLGLQLWNSIRVLDFLESLEEVDSKRLGCTGASGGGTQTFLLTAVDDRVRVSAPVVMVSARMQGGCLCENAPNLRLDTNNVEIAAMAAPRPQLLVSATGDWTHSTPELEYPAIRSIYRLYGLEDRIGNVHVDAPHNYNRESREAVYRWFERWLAGRPVQEGAYERPYHLPREEVRRVFPSGKLPATAKTRAQIVQEAVHRAQTQLEALYAVNRPELEQSRPVLWGLYAHTLNAVVPPTESVRRYEQTEEDGNGQRFFLRREGVGDWIPCREYLPQDEKRPQEWIVLLSSEGMGRFEPEERLTAALLEAGYGVLSFDPFQIGEAAKVPRDRSGKHFETFNPSDAACRVQDLLTVLAYLRSRSERTHVLGTEEAGLWALWARPYWEEEGVFIADLAELPLHEDGTYLDPLHYLPGIRRAGDVVTAGVLSAPRPLRLYNVAAGLDLTPVEAAYQAYGATERLSVQSGPATTAQLLAWLQDGKQKS